MKKSRNFYGKIVRRYSSIEMAAFLKGKKIYSLDGGVKEVKSMPNSTFYVSKKVIKELPDIFNGCFKCRQVMSGTWDVETVRRSI